VLGSCVGFMCWVHVLGSCVVVGLGWVGVGVGLCCGGVELGCDEGLLHNTLNQNQPQIDQPHPTPPTAPPQPHPHLLHKPGRVLPLPQPVPVHYDVGGHRDAVVPQDAVHAAAVLEHFLGVGVGVGVGVIGGCGGLGGEGLRGGRWGAKKGEVSGVEKGRARLIKCKES